MPCSQMEVIINRPHGHCKTPVGAFSSFIPAPDASGHISECMKIATYNVNGIKSRLPNLLAWLERERPDIACLQELKAPDAAFPSLAVAAAGYKCVAKGQRSWNGVAILAQLPSRILLEVGPGRTLATLASRHPAARADGMTTLASLRHPDDSGSNEASVLSALGQLWLAGVEVDWTGFYADEERYRVSLPTYRGSGSGTGSSQGTPRSKPAPRQTKPPRRATP